MWNRRPHTTWAPRYHKPCGGACLYRSRVSLTLTLFSDGDGLWRLGSGPSTQRLIWLANVDSTIAASALAQSGSLTPEAIAHFNTVEWISNHPLPSFQATPRAGIIFLFLLTFGSTASPICGSTRYPNFVDTSLRCGCSCLRLEQKDKSFVCPYIPYLLHLGNSGIFIC